MATPAEDLNSTNKSKAYPGGDDLPPLPTGVRYASSATFELADASPHTVELWCWYYTHNRLCAIRLNGKSLSVPKQAGDSSAGRLFEFSSREGFVQGTNTLEIDVDDLSPQASSTAGPPRFCMALGGFWMAPRPELLPPNCPTRRFTREAAIPAITVTSNAPAYERRVSNDPQPCPNSRDVCCRRRVRHLACENGELSSSFTTTVFSF